METNRDVIQQIEQGLSPQILERVDAAAQAIIRAKESGGKVVAVVGSGPNLHEGVTTLLAELMHKGLVDGVSLSSAVVNHEMGGTLEKVKRIQGEFFGLDPKLLPLDGIFEVSILPEDAINEIHKEVSFDKDLYYQMLGAEGRTIIKAAGNMAFPTGLRTEYLARELLPIAREMDIPFEQLVGLGADPMTMLGAGATLKLPVLVTVPQLVGGGEVGLAVGDSISISARCRRIAELLESADVIVESALALSQEIHDGPFETCTGHGLWAGWEGEKIFSLAEKRLIRIDMDPNLERAWKNERDSHSVSDAVNLGLPKTKSMEIPFRMEMSGFARLPGSLPIVGDIGEIWPLLALRVADALGVTLSFMCYKQSLPAGAEVREWIVDNVQAVDREKIFKELDSKHDPL